MDILIEFRLLIISFFIYANETDITWFSLPSAIFCIFILNHFAPHVIPKFLALRASFDR